MMKIAQFTALPMAVVAIQVNDKTTKKALKKAVGAGMVAAIPAVTGQQQTCQDVLTICRETCAADHDFMKIGDCWGNDVSRCVACECNDGTDLSPALPLECTNDVSVCRYDVNGWKNTCPGSTTGFNATDFEASVDQTTATCDDSREACTALCGDFGFPQIHECWGSEDNRCAKCICNDGQDMTLELPVECTNSGCGGPACPVSKVSSIQADPTCQENNAYCQATCAAAGQEVARTECSGQDPANRCVLCTCRNPNGGVVTDFTSLMPLQCTSRECYYGDLTNECPN
jgi:hypothetical protein